MRIQQQLSAKWFLIGIQWAVPVGSLFFILQLLALKAENQSFVEHYLSFFSEPGITIILAALLLFTLLNVSSEALKWKYAMRENSALNFSESFLQTLMAMAAGFITPFRSGAIVSRMLTSENTSKPMVLRAMVHMAVAQTMITILLGCLGLSGWLFFSGNPAAAWVVVTAFTSTFFLTGYFLVGGKSLSFRRLSWLEIKLDPILFAFSLIRYLIFTAQYFFILVLFGVESDPLLLCCLIQTTYLVNTFVPAGILGKIGIRELSGILIIGETTGFVFETSCAAFLIWMLNQALPAFLGSLFFVRRNLRNSL